MITFKPSKHWATVLLASLLTGALSGAVAAAFVGSALQGTPLWRSLFPVAATGDRAVDRQINDLLREEAATIAVVEQVTPAVVSLVIEKRRGDLTRDDYLYDFFPADFALPLAADEADELVEVGGGSGFFVGADGLIITNKHVVEDDAAVYTVLTHDAVKHAATVVASDPFLDIAVLDIEGEGYPIVNFADSDTLRIGQTVIAIGNTLSEYRDTVTKGVVSGINRRVEADDEQGASEVIEHAIQTDAAINPGNSGGPLINLLGEVVGVNTAISYEGEAVGFAIPSNEVRQVVEDIHEFGRIVRPWLGVRYLTLDEALAKARGLSYEQGALLVEDAAADEAAVIPGSPAEAAGLRAGDIILSVDGVGLDAERSLSQAVGEHQPGDRLSLQIARGGEIFILDVVLAEYETD